MIPVVFLLFGLTSSLHCVGMCGPLSMLASNGEGSSWKYQLGRLLGYLTIGTALSFVGQAALNVLLRYVGIGFWYFLLVLVVVSLFVLFSSKLNFKAPKWIERLSLGVTKVAMSQKNSSLKAFLMGVSSVFLPCGVLYLAVISLVALSTPLLTAVGILFFWMGTVPLLHFGLPLLRRTLDRFSVKLSQVNAVVVILMCVAVLFNRYPNIVQDILKHCH